MATEMELNTGDPRFDPDGVVIVNGYRFVRPSDRPGAAEVLRRLIRDLENGGRPGGGDPVPAYARRWQRENR